jgi:hypothetical protein
MNIYTKSESNRGSGCSTGTDHALEISTTDEQEDIMPISTKDDRKGLR